MRKCGFFKPPETIVDSESKSVTVTITDTST